MIFYNCSSFISTKIFSNLIYEEIPEQFSNGSELENGFENIKSKHFITYLLKAFSPDTPQSINIRIRVRKNTMEK